MIIVSPLRRTFDTIYPLLQQYLGTEAEELFKKYKKIASEWEQAIQNKDLSVFNMSPVWLKDGVILVDFRLAERGLFSLEGNTPGK